MGKTGELGCYFNSLDGKSTS